MVRRGRTRSRSMLLVVLALAAVGGPAAAPAVAQTDCAVPAPAFGRVDVTFDGGQVGLMIDVREWAFTRGLHYTAVNAATGERIDLGAATGETVLVAVPATLPPGTYTIEAAWEQGTCRAADGGGITAWSPRTVSRAGYVVRPPTVVTPKAALRAFERTRPGGARIGAQVQLTLDCRGRVNQRPKGAVETAVRWTTDGSTPGPGSRVVRARASSCSGYARRSASRGTAQFVAEQAMVLADLMSPGEQGLALPGGAFPRPAPVLRVWLELRLGGKVLIATRARFVQRVVRGRFCTGAAGAQRCRRVRHVETRVTVDAGSCPGMPDDRCRRFTVART